MRKVRYSVAASLDGYIAGPNGEHDWIIMDPAFDFGAFFSAFDTVLLGRGTFEKSRAMHGGGGGSMPGMTAIVFSKTLRPADFPDTTIASDAVATVKELKNKPGKDIWLMGGGGLFRSLLEAGLVDAVEVSVVPVLLGSGIPLLPGNYKSFGLSLVSNSALPSGIVMLTYAPAPKGAAKGKKKR